MLDVECTECHTNLPPKVCQSAAGHYVGYWCPNCGPYDRCTGYMSKEEAESLLASFVRA